MPSFLFQKADLGRDERNPKMAPSSTTKSF